MNAYGKRPENNDTPDLEPTPIAPTDLPAASEMQDANPQTESAAQPDAPANPAPVTDQSPDAQVRKYYEQLLRTTADFDNFRKRANRERQDAAKYANESLLQKLIPILDNFDMALAAASNAEEKSVQALQTGIQMVHQQFRNVLTEAGLTEIDASNQPFDPNWHQAVAQQESSDIPDGHVLTQMRKGYKLRDRLLRPAMVVVSKTPAPESSQT